MNDEDSDDTPVENKPQAIRRIIEKQSKQYEINHKKNRSAKVESPTRLGAKRKLTIDFAPKLIDKNGMTSPKRTKKTGDKYLYMPDEGQLRHTLKDKFSDKKREMFISLAKEQ